MSVVALSNINIAEISFVKAGANGKEFIAKNGKPSLLVTIRKTDPVKKLCFGVIYEPDVVDSQGEKATAAEIEKAAWGALKNQAIIKTDHQEPAKAFLCESYIAKTGDPDGYKAGSWVGGVKVEDDALWADIEKGDYKAFSMGGEAVKTTVEKNLAGKTPEQILKEIYADSMVYATNFQDALKLLNSIAGTLNEVVKTVAGDHATVKKSIDGMPAQMEALGKAVQAANDTLQKIAAKVTDGHVTSSTPGAGPQVDPAKY